MITLSELLAWERDHPEDPLIPQALFDGRRHTVSYANRTWVETPCGCSGPARDHSLVFCLPRSSVDCPRCRALRAG